MIALIVLLTGIVVLVVLICASCTSRPSTPAGAPATSGQATATTEPTTRSADAVTLVVLGDSNSSADFVGLGQGAPWPERLVSKLATDAPDTKVQLVNSARFGYTSRDLRSRVATEALAHKPDVVVVMVGTNDPGYGIPTARTIENVKATIKRIRAARPDVRFVLMQPPVAQSVRVSQTAGAYEMAVPYDRSEDASNSLAAINAGLEELASETGIPLVRTWDALAEQGWDGRSPTRSPLVLDGIHLTGAGQEAVAEAALPTIAEAIRAAGQDR